MISYEIEKGCLKKCIVQGDSSEIFADVSLLISLVYGSMKKHDESLAAEFETMMLMTHANKDLNNVVFSETVADAIISANGGLFNGVTVDENAIAITKAMIEAMKDGDSEE